MVTWNYDTIPYAMLYNFVIAICPTTLFKVTYTCYVHACVFALKHLKWHVILKYLALLLAISGDNIIYSNLYCMTSRKWYNYCTFCRKCYDMLHALLANTTGGSTVQFGFPMSTYLRQCGCQLGRNARMLASQAPDRLANHRKVGLFVLQSNKKLLILITGF